MHSRHQQQIQIIPTYLLSQNNELGKAQENNNNSDLPHETKAQKQQKKQQNQHTAQ